MVKMKRNYMVVKQLNKIWGFFIMGKGKFDVMEIILKYSMLFTWLIDSCIDNIFKGQ